MSRIETTEEALPPDLTVERQDMALEIRGVSAAEAFEAAWCAGRAPRIEAFLPADAETPLRAALLRALLQREVGLRRRAGEEPRLDDYLDRFPADRPLVEEVVGRTRESWRGAESDPLPETEPAEPTQDAPADAAPTERAEADVFSEPDPDALTQTIDRTVGRDEEPTARDANQPPTPETPERFGRYVVRKPIGEGAFGRVYHAWDDVLERDVAIKVPRAGAFATEARAEDFRREAKLAGALKHDGIVTVYDVSRDDRGGLFVVLEYVEGCSLGVMLGREPAPFRRLAELIAQAAEALHYAHVHGVVHRDIKPSNLLVDPRGGIRVADFGLAVKQEGVEGLAREVAGTPAYMAPEQVRGESHRLEGRTDVWGLGVVLYQLLTGRLPFQGTRPEMFRQILHEAPPPPRRRRPDVPRELERICLKCLAKRMTDRYASARDLAVDLRGWLTDGVDTRPTRGPGGRVDAESGESLSGVDAPISPRGLRPFEAADADAFLDLLPGPRDRHGFPEAVTFWKTRIEAVDPSESFPLGVVYGPSGSGKSSLIRAGLIPRLAPHVLPIYVEAAPGRTGERLLKRLRKHCPDLPEGLRLNEVMLALRESPGLRRGRKIVVFLDQFEQWLHADMGTADDALVEAVRHCDGAALQCLVLVREDFGMATMRFFNAVEVPVVEGKNYTTVDRFDARHARRVLELFGRSVGCLPAVEPPTADQDAFLDAAVRELSGDGTLVPVRVALFVELFRRKDWTTAVFRKVCGTGGIEAAFLEESLGSLSPNPRRRLHATAARGVLAALLPAPGVDIRGHMKGRGELEAVARYGPRTELFNDLLLMLDDELRLITPCDPLRGDLSPAARRADSTLIDAVAPDSPVHQPYYQLAHDYLVPALRKWLKRKRSETLPGRAHLMLEELTASWAATAAQERRPLPTLIEWLGIVTLTRRSEWTPIQSVMMSKATRRNVRRLLGSAALAAAAAGASLWGWWEIRARERSAEAQSLVLQLRSARIDRVPRVLEEMEPYRDDCRQALVDLAASLPDDDPEKTRAHLALAAESSAGVPFLVGRLLRADVEEFRVVGDALRRWTSLVEPRLSEVLAAPASSPAAVLRAAAALAQDVPPDDARWKAAASRIVGGLIAEGAGNVPGWCRLLAPVREPLDGPLTARLADPATAETERVTAVEAACELDDRDPKRLVALLKHLKPNEFAIPVRRMKAVRQAMIPPLVQAVEERPSYARDVRIDEAHRRANAALGLLLLDEPGHVWPLLRCSEAPNLRTALIHRMLRAGVDPGLLARQLQVETAPGVRQALLLALGAPALDAKAGPLDSAKADVVARLFTDDPDAGVHSAAEWLLRVRGEADRLARLQETLKGTTRGGWLVDGLGLTYAVVPAGTFAMGTLKGDEERDGNETPHDHSIERPFAVATHEISLADYRRLQPHPRVDGRISPTDDTPATKLSWFDGVRFCMYLDRTLGAGPGGPFYEELDETTLQLKINPKGTGHRLPTEAEWERAARAGTTTPWHFGDSAAWLPSYGWVAINSDERLRPVGSLMPNPLGLFDVYGNVQEWCHNDKLSYSIEMIRLEEEIKSRAVRGGGYRSAARSARSAKREILSVNEGMSIVGIRVVRTLPE